MPGSTKKALYIAKNLTQLNVLAGETIKVAEGKCRLYAKSSEKVYTNAEESELLGDEERAYVLYMKFLNIIQGLRKTAEYKKSKKYYDDLIGINKLNTALSQAEILSSSLKARYEEKEAIEVSEKLEKLGRDSESETKKEVVEEKLEEKEEHVKVAEVETPDQISEKKGLMLCDKLYKLMHDDSTSVVVIDVRPAEQFLASHINFSRCINIPRHIIYAGCTVKQLEDHVPEESREQWSRRGSVDFIVLLDWTSNDADLQPRSTITCLKDAIYKWDQETIVKSEPLVLDGGYEEWLNMYPTLTTNASIPRPPSYSNFSSSAVSLETIDYDLELTFLKSAEELEAEKMKNQRNNMISTNQNVTPPLVQNNTPLIPDRKSKPVSNNMVIPTTVKSNENIERIKNDFSKPKGLSLSDLKKKLDIGSDSSQLPVKDINIKNDKPENKMSSEIINKPVPSVDRTLKPKATPSNNVVIEPETLEDVNSEVKQIGSTVQVETEAQVDRLHEQQESKQRELESYRTESKKLALETEARRAKLSKEKEQFEKISEMKSKAQEETEELQKKKEAIENEIRNLEKEKADRLAEEKHKLEEWKRAQKEEEEQKAKLKQLRELKRAEEARKKEDQLKKQQQAEKQKAKEAEEQAKEKAQNETKAREAQLREAQLREAQLREAQLKEAQAKADREKREREKKLQEDEQKKSGPSKAPSLLPVGWEKRYDATNNKYYYINHHTKQTQWDPPTVSGKVNSQSKDGVYKTKLKTEEDAESGGGGGLKRSHSSPNIAKMMQDEAERKSQPGVNRTAKPQGQPQSVRSLELQKHRGLSEAKVRDFTPIWGSVSHGLTGLRNQGNTCYMNSTLQCLSNTGFLTTYLLSENYRHDINVKNKFGTHGEIAEEYAALVTAMWSGQYKSITPREFKKGCAKHCSTFSGYDQQDSQELLSYLLDWLHEDLNKIQNRPRLREQQNDGIPEEEAAARAWTMHKSCHDSVIVQLFQGQLKSTVMCKTCEKKSVTFDTFMYLSLDIPSQTRCSLKECLLAFSKEEKMTGDSRWNCPRCKVKREATKRIVIWKLPPILIIVLKRFYHKGMWRQKNSAYVDFPIDHVDFNGFVSGPKSTKSYSLYAMSNHYGTMEGGHYTAFCKNPKLDRWFKFDDHEVYEYSKTDIKSSAAYFLFYSSVS